MTESPVTDRVRRIQAGEPRAIAQAISLIERDAPEAVALLGALAGKGHAYLVGITGPPGAGKSTLVTRLVEAARALGRRVAVLAVDPSSAFSGGAILGDRVRMQGHALDAGVFIRSMATRGHLGGLARHTADAATVLDAAGFDLVIIETVGVGQDEIEIVRAADVSVVVLVPGTGDEVQALKAGVMEIADLFVVNKADLAGADHAVAALQMVLGLEADDPSVAPRAVLRVVATSGEGVAGLLAALDRFRTESEDRIVRRRAARAEWRLRAAVNRQMQARLDSGLASADWAAAVTDVALGATSSHEVAARLVGRLFPSPSPHAIEAVLDHVGIVTGDVALLDRFLRGALGLAVDTPEDVSDQRVRVRFVETGAARLELVEPLDATSPVSRFLERQGPGLHHVALRVPDLRAVLTRLASHGVRLVDREPRPGAHGRLVAFVHPASTGGVLVELVEGTADALR